MKRVITSLIHALPAIGILFLCLLIPFIVEGIFIIPFLWLPIPTYILKVITIAILIKKYFPFFIAFVRQKLLFSILFTILFLVVSIKVYFPPSDIRKGFLDYRVMSHEFSSAHWYFINRVNPVFPFDPTGMAYVSKKDNLTLPTGYVTQQSITEDAWYGIVRKRFLVMAVAYAVFITIFASCFAGFLLSKFVYKKFKIKNS